MAKTSISLRLEPHELHIVRESLRLYDYILEWQLTDPEGKPPDFNFNFGVQENPHMVRVTINELMAEMGGVAPQITQPRPSLQAPQPTQDLNLMKSFKRGWRQGGKIRRAMKL